ncbi:MAG: WG repeat-containing protein [Sphingobacteriia bacterium]
MRTTLIRVIGLLASCLFVVLTSTGYAQPQAPLPLRDTSARALRWDQPLAAVKIHYRWGYIDTNGALVQPPWLLAARDFSEGLAAVRFSSGKWGYLDKRGMVVVPWVYDAAYDFRGGLALARKDSLWYLLNTWGDYSQTYADSATASQALLLHTGSGQPRPQPPAIPQRLLDKHRGQAILPTPNPHRYLLRHRHRPAWGIVDQDAHGLLKPSYDTLYALKDGYIGLRSGQLFWLDSTLARATPLHAPGYRASTPLAAFSASRYGYAYDELVRGVRTRRWVWIAAGRVTILPLACHTWQPSPLQWTYNRCALSVHTPEDDTELQGEVQGLVGRGSWGYLDEAGKLVIKPVFHAARGFF